jgi:DNA end-binding protein Ku
VLHTLYYPDELHQAHKNKTPKAKYTAKELELARSLVTHLKAPFQPKQYKDTYRENVERLIKQKQKGQKITTVEQPRKAPVIDLMEALKRSLQSGMLSQSAQKNGRTKKSAKRRKAA